MLLKSCQRGRNKTAAGFLLKQHQLSSLAAKQQARKVHESCPTLSVQLKQLLQRPRVCLHQSSFHLPQIWLRTCGQANVTLWQKKRRRANCRTPRSSGKQKRWRVTDRGTTGRRGQRRGARRLKCQQSHCGGTSSSGISTLPPPNPTPPHPPSEKPTKPGLGRCAANGSIALIDPPVSPLRPSCWSRSSMPGSESAGGGSITASPPCCRCHYSF